MKDLNTSKNLIELLNIGVDSLKLEGRMKNPEYVKIVTSEYRKKLIIRIIILNHLILFFTELIQRGSFLVKTKEISLILLKK